MYFSRSRTLITHTYSLTILIFHQSVVKKDLSVLLSADLSFHFYIKSISHKVYKTLVFVEQILFDFMLTSELKALYCSLVRPLLEYGSVLWDPHTASDCNHRMIPKALSILCWPCVKYPSHIAWLLSTSPWAFSINATLTHRRVDINLKFLQNLIDGSTDPT